MAAGALAGSATVLITNPIWVVNTRMTARKSESDEPLKVGDVEVEKKGKPNTVSTFLKIIREDGPGRLFAGVLPALVLVINPILQYTIFEQLKQVLEKRRKVTATDSFLLGALGKLAATSITYPYITVKSRAHVATGEGREGMTASLKRIVREEGVAGLYGGTLLMTIAHCLSQTNVLQVLHPRSPSLFLPQHSCSHLRTSSTMLPSRHVELLRRRHESLSSDHCSSSRLRRRPSVTTPPISLAHQICKQTLGHVTPHKEHGLQDWNARHEKGSNVAFR